MTGDALVHWTARIAVACYLARITIDMSSLAPPQKIGYGRAVWTLGCAIFLTHVAAAFHFVHHWSHATAWEHTRRETLAHIGWDSGAGIYANYAFAAWWMADTIAWWLTRDWPQQHRSFYWATQAYFAFMVLSATVVFGPREWIVVAGAWCAMAGCLWKYRSASGGT